MNRYFLIIKMLQQNDSNTGRNAAVMIIVLLLLFPLFIIILIATALSMPADWIKDHLLLEGTPAEELYIIQQIRPDLIQQDQTVLEGYDFGMPINRTIQHYFGDEANGRTLDYLTYNCDGDNLYAIADGEVVEVDSSEALGGWYIVVEHEAPADDEANWYLYSKYWAVDMEAEHAEVGDSVDQGDIIGHALTADEDHATMIFCFQMYGDSDYEPIDPLPYIGEKEFDEEIIKHHGDNVVIVGNEK